MKVTSAKESGGAYDATRSRLSCSEIVAGSGYSVNHLFTQWQSEARRLRAEYERTGKVAHLRALEVHRSAIRARAAELSQ